MSATPKSDSLQRCTATATGDLTHDWWPTRARCSKPAAHRGAHIEESPNSVAGAHCVIWRDGEPAKAYWYPKGANDDA